MWDYQEKSTKAGAQHSGDLAKMREKLLEAEKMLTEAESSLLETVPKSELRKVLIKIDVLEAEHAAVQQEVLKLQHVNDKLGSMTPRPNWQELRAVNENKVWALSYWS